MNADWTTIGAVRWVGWSAVVQVVTPKIRMSGQMRELMANLRRVGDRLSRLAGWTESGRGRPVPAGVQDARAVRTRADEW